MSAKSIVHVLLALVLGAATFVPAAAQAASGTAIVAQTDAEATEPSPRVARGDTGELVIFWQDRLNEWLRLVGSDRWPIAVDGIFGPETEAATLEFQGATDAVEVDSVVDPEDRVALEDAIEGLIGRQAVRPVGEMETETRRSDDFPAAGATAYLTEIRTGDHDGFERIVFEFEGGDLDYSIGYVDDAPRAPSGRPVMVDGEETLEIHLTGASRVDLTGTEPDQTYNGSDRFSPDELRTVEEMALVEDFEGHLVWTAGVDREAAFAVAVLEDPRRLVIDIAEALPGGVLTACENPEGFAISYPRSWSANDGTVVSECSQFHPEPFEVRRGDARVAAISTYIEPVAFADVAVPRESEIARAPTTIDGLQAVRLEYETEEDLLWPAGTPVTLYAVDLSPNLGDESRTLIIETVGLSSFDYGENQAVLDRMARTLRITDEEVDTAPAAVATYQGAGELKVVGELRETEACLGIPPGGEISCAGIPGPGQLVIHELRDLLGPIVAGVTGHEVFRVVAERPDGTSSAVITAPIDTSDVRGFSFLLGPDEIARLTWFDVTGNRLGTLEP